MLFKRWVNKVDFTLGKELVYSNTFKDLQGLNVKDGEFYNDNDVWLSKDCVSVTPFGLEIVCKKDPATYTSWQGTRSVNWISGMVYTRGLFELVNGIWVFEAKACESWPAIWLLKKEHMEPGFTGEKIIPEVDIMEVCNGVLRTTIHYGYSDVYYRLHGIGSKIVKPDDKFHQFAVELLPTGYKFYFDQILVSEFHSDDPDFVSDYPCYVVINNAADEYSKESEYKIIVKSMKVYKN